MKAEQLEVGKVYKTFSFETALAIYREYISAPQYESIYGIGKETWESDLSTVKLVGKDERHAQVRSVHGDREYIWSVPCCTIREEAQVCNSKISVI